MMRAPTPPAPPAEMMVPQVEMIVRAYAAQRRCSLVEAVMASGLLAKWGCRLRARHYSKVVVITTRLGT